MRRLFGFNRDSSGNGTMCKTIAGEVVEFIRYENTFFVNGLILERCVVRLQDGTEKKFAREQLRGRLPAKQPRRHVDPPWMPFAFFGILMLFLIVLIAAAFTIEQHMLGNLSLPL